VDQELSMICVAGGREISEEGLDVDVGRVNGIDGMWNVRGNGGEGPCVRRVSNYIVLVLDSPVSIQGERQK